jgi:hypothetical protein
MERKLPGGGTGSSRLGAAVSALRDTEQALVVQQETERQNEWTRMQREWSESVALLDELQAIPLLQDVRGVWGGGRVGLVATSNINVVAAEYHARQSQDIPLAGLRDIHVGAMIELAVCWPQGVFDLGMQNDLVFIDHPHFYPVTNRSLANYAFRYNFVPKDRPNATPHWADSSAYYRAIGIEVVPSSQGVFAVHLLFRGFPRVLDFENLKAKNYFTDKIYAVDSATKRAEIAQNATEYLAQSVLDMEKHDFEFLRELDEWGYISYGERKERAESIIGKLTDMVGEGVRWADTQYTSFWPQGTPGIYHIYWQDSPRSGSHRTLVYEIPDDASALSIPATVPLSF